MDKFIFDDKTLSYIENLKGMEKYAAEIAYKTYKKTKKDREKLICKAIDKFLIDGMKLPTVADKTKAQEAAEKVWRLMDDAMAERESAKGGHKGIEK